MLFIIKKSISFTTNNIHVLFPNMYTECTLKIHFWFFLYMYKRSTDSTTALYYLLSKSVLPKCVIQHYGVHFYRSGFLHIFIICNAARLLIHKKCISKRLRYFFLPQKPLRVCFNVFTKFH